MRCSLVRALSATPAAARGVGVCRPDTQTQPWVGIIANPWLETLNPQAWHVSSHRPLDEVRFITLGRRERLGLLSTQARLLIEGMYR